MSRWLAGMGGFMRAQNAWDLIWDGDDLAFAGSALATWTDRKRGIVVTPEAGLEPTNLGPLANGHQGLLFPTTSARCGNSGTIFPGSHSIWALLIACDYDNTTAAGGIAAREYDTQDANDGGANNLRVTSHQSNDGAGGIVRGHARGDQHWNLSAITPTNGLQIVTVRQNADGSVSYFLDNVLVATVAGTLPTALPAANFFMGASFGAAPLTQCLKGTIYEVRRTYGRDLGDGVILDAHGQLMSKLGAGGWRETDVASLAGCFDESGKTTTAGAIFTGTALTQWADKKAGGTRNLGFAVAAKPNEGVRMNGRPTIDFDGITHQGTTAAACSTFATVGAYEVLVGVEVDAIATDLANTETNAMILGDAAGNWGLYLRRAAGVNTVHGYHFVTGPGRKSAPAAGLVLGQKALIHWRFDGTTITCQVNDAAPATILAGNVSGLAGVLNVGKRGAVATTLCDMRLGRAWLFNAYLSDTDRASARARMGSLIGVAV